MAAFFASGASSLILELVWTRQFTLVFGTTEGALSTVLAAFMGGLAIGSYAFGVWCRHWRQPLWFYAGLEIAIAVSAFGLTLALPQVDVLLAAYWSYLSQHPAFFGILRFLTVFIVVAIPSTLMGGTLSVVCQALSPRDRFSERIVGQLYASNLAGAVAGTFAAGFFLIPIWGMLPAILFAMLLNILAAAIAALAASQRNRTEWSEPEPGSRELIQATEFAFPHRQRFVVLASVGVSGYAILLQEVLWFRSLRLVIGSSTYALTLLLVTFLLGLAFGSHVVAWLSPRIQRPVLLLAGLQAAICISVLAGMYMYPSLPELFLRGFLALGPGNGIFLVQATVAAVVLFPTTVLAGAVFPLSARVFASEPGWIGADVGRLYATLTSGNVLGAASAVAVLANVGLTGGLTVAAALHLIASIALWQIAEVPCRARLRLAAVTAAMILLFPLFRREWRPLITTSGVFQNADFAGNLFDSSEEFFRSVSVFRLLFYREGTSATVSVYEEPSLESHRHLSLAIDGKVDASTGNDMSTQVLLAHLPLLLIPGAGDVCVIGWGSGITAGSVLLHPVSRVTAIEIEPAVVEASALFEGFNHRPLADSRLRLVVDDARSVLLRESHQYHVLISEPSNPWLAGSSNLFTREFLQLGKSRLHSNGIFAQWIHLYGLDAPLLRMFFRTFHSVFPHLLVFQTSEGDLLLLGSEVPLRMDPGRINERMQHAAIRKDLKRAGVAAPEDLLMRFRFGEREMPDFAGVGPFNTDAHPTLEFGAARSLYQDTLAENSLQVFEAFRGLAPYLDSALSEPVVAAVALRALRQGDESVARMLAQELRAPPASAQTWWLLGELAWRRQHFVTAEDRWRRGLQADPACLGCAISAAFGLQQEGKFVEADKVLGIMQASSREDPLIAVLRGINRFYLGDRTGSVKQLDLVLKSRHAVEDDDVREIVERRLFPLGILAAFYAIEASGAGQQNAAGTTSGELNGFLQTWRAELFRNPTLHSWAGLLSAIEFHASRTPAATAEQKLIVLVVKEVLEPLTHFNRGIRHALRGDHEDAQKELAEAARRVNDPEGRQAILEVTQKLIAWQATH